MEKIYAILGDLHPEFDFESSTNYIEDGFLDSFDIVSLVSDIEADFDILIDALDIVPENFETIESISSLIKKNGGSL